MVSVRLDAETERELRWAATESGKSISDLIRQGLQPVLAYIRAEWYHEHGGEDDWETIAIPHAAGRRDLKSSFGVPLTGDQLIKIGDAAQATGVSISAYLREAGLALAAASRQGGIARCGHMSVTPVRSASCGICGPLPVRYTLPAS